MPSSQEFLQKIISPQLDFEAARDDEKFCRFFSNLYNIEIFKNGLDLILSKLATKQIRFEIKVIRNWDTNQGCYLRSEKLALNSARNNFERIRFEKIIIRSFNHNVLAHEMAHACQFSSQIDLNDIFRQAIIFDMKAWRTTNFALDGEIKRLMIEDIKVYPPQYFLSEFFARFFELLSLSRSINPSAGFCVAEICEFFINTHKFITEIFNPNIHSQINSQIANQTSKIAQEIKQVGAKFLIRDQINPTTGSKRGISWVDSIKKTS